MIFCKKEQSLKAIWITNIILVWVTLWTMKHTWYTLTLMDGVEILCLGKLGLSIGTSLYFDTHKFCQRLMVALKHTRFAAKILPHTIYLSENNLSIILSLEIRNIIWYNLIFFSNILCPYWVSQASWPCYAKKLSLQNFYTKVCLSFWNISRD